MPEPVSMGPGNRILLQGAVAKIFNNVIIYHKNKIFISVGERIQVIGHFCFHHLSGSQDIKCPRSWKGLFSSHLPITIETTTTITVKMAATPPPLPESLSVLVGTVTCALHT